MLDPEISDSDQNSTDARSETEPHVPTGEYLLVFPVFRFLFRGSTAGKHNVPSQGALVVVANHGSHLDPPLLGHALGRPVAFMAKAELFNVPLLGAVIRACGAYPVRRGASDREAIRSATSCLEQGWATGVFLDGTRQQDGRLNAPLPGAALLAARSGAPLLPVAIHNATELSALAAAGRLVPIQLRIGNVRRQRVAAGLISTPRCIAAGTDQRSPG